LDRSGGLGLELVKMLAKQLAGGLEYTGGAQGTAFTVRVKI